MQLLSRAASGAVDDKMELRVGKKYRLSKKIGGGSFGDIFHGESTTRAHSACDWAALHAKFLQAASLYGGRSKRAASEAYMMRCCAHRRRRD